MTNRPFVLIQPKPGLPAPAPGPGSGPGGGSSKTAHTITQIACNPCRRSKIKCDGDRPFCLKCRARGQTCVYEFPQEGVSRTSARKEIISDLQGQVHDLRDLLRHISHRPDEEAQEILSRLRRSEDPVLLAHSIRQADLLLPNPGVHRHGRGEHTTMAQLDADALERSLIKVPARPWTVVAGDGIVSELVSSWFRWDDPFMYAFIERDDFIREMRAGSPTTAKHCSPFLLNLMCAMRSFFSDSVRTAERITHKNLTESFLHEAVKLFDHGVPSLPIVKGLWIMFGISILNAQDRSGTMHRLASYGMLNRIQLDKSFANLPDDTDEGDSMRRDISQTAWGQFWLESLSNANFPGDSFVPPPTLPCLFPSFQDGHHGANVDLFGEPFSAQSPQPPIVIGVPNVLCRFSLLMHQVVTHNHDESNEYDEADLLKRRQFYADALDFSNALPLFLQHEHNFTPQTCFLRYVRPLHPAVGFDGEAGLSVKDLTFKHCTIVTDVMEQYFRTWTTNEFSSMVFFGPLNAGTILLPLLPDKQADALFTRVCQLMYHISSSLPIARYTLKGWQAALWSMKLKVPEGVQPYFRTPAGGTENMRNLPTNLLVTPFSRVSGDVIDDSEELGALLAAWSVDSDN
ncbi:putative C6 transcription factor [Nemania sp. NC0429]|nr:putative C6 transcription factor [Nemania sp. NC0429]